MGILDGKVAIVTGGAQGIGRGAVEAFVREGCKVLINDLGVTRDGREPNSEIVDAFVEELRAHGYAVAGNASDCSTVEGAERLAADCLAAFGRIDILYNN